MKEASLQQRCEEVEKTVDRLSEHWENVQVFVSSYNSIKGITSTFSLGTGDFYAREGLIREWLVRSEQMTRNGVRTKRK